ncbi:hypothetical protein CsSME_00029324 [Camellia sinensis var. sinensis]
MASVSSQPQFRYTQPPSKVLHLRNLPWECIEEELIELGKPFGKVVNTKCNVGANRNQAFIEFAELNQAIAMISYYASSSEPAQVRGKTVYLQYSNRQEIVNNKTTADVAGNVLLVTIEGTDARLVSIDVLHLAHVKDIPSMAAYCIGRKSACVFVSFLLCLTLALSSLLLHFPIPTILRVQSITNQESVLIGMVVKLRLGLLSIGIQIEIKDSSGKGIPPSYRQTIDQNHSMEDARFGKPNKFSYYLSQKLLYKHKPNTPHRIFLTCVELQWESLSGVDDELCLLRVWSYFHNEKQTILCKENKLM